MVGKVVRAFKQRAKIYLEHSFTLSCLMRLSSFSFSQLSRSDLPARVRCHLHARSPPATDTDIRPALLTSPNQNPAGFLTKRALVLNFTSHICSAGSTASLKKGNALPSGWQKLNQRNYTALGGDMPNEHPAKAQGTSLIREVSHTKAYEPKAHAGGMSNWRVGYCADPCT